MKKCLICMVPKELDEFHLNPCGKQLRQSYCKLCMKVKGKEYNEKTRLAVFVEYGTICYCCAESNTAFLSLDHKNRDGKKDGKRGRGWYLRLIREGFPDKDVLRVACFNCNMGREGNGGVCPHENVRE